MNLVVARSFRSAVLGSAFFVLSSAVACTRPLRDAQPSAEALARAVLDAVERRDEAALRRVAISEAEFRDHVWPELPASRPERNMPMAYVWGELQQKSDNSLKTTLAEHGGQHYDLVQVRFDAETTDYTAFRVHRKAVFVVRKGAGGPIELRLSGSMLEGGGEWKIFSFVVND